LPDPPAAAKFNTATGGVRPRYAYDGENEDDETAAASITRENATLDNEDGDGDRDAAAPEVHAVDRAGEGHEERA
jgi:hypothetical protein